MLFSDNKYELSACWLWNNQMLKSLMHNAICNNLDPKKIGADTCRYVTSPHTYIETLNKCGSDP